MKPFPLPVRVTGPGSQPETGDLHYLPMPSDIDTFAMPSMPGEASTSALVLARDALARFLDSIQSAGTISPADGPKLDLAHLPPDALSVLNDMLGEGEVAIQVTGAQPLHIQETVFTGVWRVCVLDHARVLTADWLQAAPIPDVVLASARDAAASIVPSVAIPDGAMNSPALLREIETGIAARQPGDRAHVLNLTLLPLTAEDHDVLVRALPVGPVAMMSRGFGNCRITSTGTRDVWRVQYFNSMGTLILDTIEIVDLPEVALAAPEDLADSATRLAELIDWISETCPDRVAG